MLKKHKSWEFRRFFGPNSQWGFFLFSDSLKAYCKYIKKELNVLPVFPQKICVWFYLSNRWIFFLHSISVTNVPTLKCSLRPPLLSLIWYKRIDIFARISQFVSGFFLWKSARLGTKTPPSEKNYWLKWCKMYSAPFSSKKTPIIMYKQINQIIGYDFRLFYFITATTTQKSSKFVLKKIHI